MHELRSRVNEVSVRVRASPFGQDRYNRYYWILPHHSGVFVEGVESGAVENPAIKLAPNLPSPNASGGSMKNVDDVRLCVQDMVEAVSRSKSSELEELESAYTELKLERLNSTNQETEGIVEPAKSIPASRSSKGQANRKLKPVPIEHQRGWWLVTDPNQLDTIPPYLHHRGIRERQLSRTLTKHVDSVKRAAYQPGKSTFFSCL